MENNKGTLERSLSPASVWALALGSIIGFGCFILPTDFMAEAGPLGAVLGLLLGGVVMMVIGKNISFMIAVNPKSGGQVAYAADIFGKTHGYICGWMLSLGYVSIIALNATALGMLVKFVAPSLLRWGYLYQIAGWDVWLGEILLSSFFILLFAVFNLRGGKIAARMQVVMVVLMVGAVLLISLAAMLSDTATAGNLTPLFAPGKAPVTGVLAIVAMAPWLYLGFDTIPQTVEEYNFSPKKVPVLIFAAILCGAAVYAITCLATGVVFPWQQLVAAQHEWALGVAMETAVGTAGVLFLVVAICMGIFTGMNGFYMASSRLMYGMAEHGLLPKAFGRIHPRFKTPGTGILFAMGISLIAPWFGRQVISWVVDMCSVGTAIGYLYTCAAALVVQRRGKKTALPARIHPATCILGVACALGILLLLVVPGTPGSMGPQSWVAPLVWAAIGICFYFLCVKKTTAGITDAQADR